jgi:hypothetical protein
MKTASLIFFLCLLTGSLLGQQLSNNTTLKSAPEAPFSKVILANAKTSDNGLHDNLNAPEVVPGLRLTSDALVWILENHGTQPRLIPLIHHDADIRRNVGANIARSALWEKQKMDVVITGPRADIRLHQGDISLFVEYSKAEEIEMSKASPTARVVYAILKLNQEEKARSVAWYEFSRFKGSRSLKELPLETKQARFGDFGWLQVTPAQPLPPGEYALIQMIPGKNTLCGWVFDFGVDQ